MGTKSNPGKNDCYNKALPDEPMFTLLGRDPFAPSLVRRWATERRNQIMRGERPESDLELCEEAERLAKIMESWRKMNDGKWRSG